MSRNSIGLLLVFFAFLLFFPWINRPFTGHHDFTGAFDSLMARNYLRYGLIATRLGQVTSFGGNTRPEGFSYHTHHPPGVPLLLAGIYKTFGEQEWAARLAMVLFALGSVFLFFALVSDASSVAIATVSTIFFITTPLFIYPSILPVYEAPALFLILLQFFSFSRFSKTGKKKYAILLAIAALLGYITAWVTYFAIPILIAGELLSRKTKQLKSLLFLFVASFLFFGLHIVHTHILTGQWFGGGLDQIFLKRTGVTPETDQRYTYSTTTYIGTILKRLKDFCGLPVDIIALLGIILIIVKRKNASSHLLFLFTGMALALPVFFRNYVFVHDYVLYYASLPVCFAAGVSLSACWARMSKQEWGAIGAALVIMLVNFFFTKTTWNDLWTSKDWYEASKIIGARLRATTKPDQQILVANFKLTEQDMQLQYYADRAIIFPVKGVSNKDNPIDPDVIVNVASDLQLAPEVKEKLLTAYRLDTDHGVEYYYRK